VKFGSDLRRFSIEEGVTYDELVHSLQMIFPNKLEAFYIQYVDEDHKMIRITTTDVLREVINVTNKLKPPILRVEILPLEKTPQTVSTPEYSNWAKKQLDEELKKVENYEHVVKISGVPFYPEGTGKIDSVETVQNEEEMVESVDTPMEFSKAPPSKKMTVKETVESFSEEQKNKTIKYSEQSMENTLEYSNKILEGTIPLSKTIYESSLNSSESISNKLSTNRNVESPYINYDDIINNVSSKLEEYSSNISRDVDQFSFGINEKNDLLRKNTFDESYDDFAKETLEIVDEKSKQLIIDLDQIRSTVNTDVNIQYRDDIKNSTSEIERNVNTLSTTTNDQTIFISDNIAKDILSI